MKKRFIALLLLICMLSTGLLTSCGEASGNGTDEYVATDALEAMSHINTQELNIIDDNYRNVYEIFPYSFCDSNGDKIGDIQGIISKLDYIRDLGFNAIWLTPVHPSTTYHKYDVADYYDIDAEFGTLEDYEQLIAECHNRGIDIYMDLVVNHTSDTHEWFTTAKKYIQSLDAGEEPSVEECPYVDYYVFSQEIAGGYTDLGNGWYYESQFWSGMPDLNLDSEAVRNEIDKIVEFWLDKGVDGFRLDAVTSYYTGNDAKNIEFLTWLNTCVKEKKADAYIVGECWTNSVTYTNYAASGIDSFFNFDFATNTGTIATVIRGGSALTYGNKIVSTAALYKAQNENYIDAGFTSNHDNARVAGVLAGEDGKLKMAQAMAMLIGGSYYLYYGDEIGMKGSGDDPNKRAPMNWVEDSSGEGMCRLSEMTQTVKMSNGTVESQQADKNSLYYYVQQAMKLRNTFPEIARGETVVITECSNEDVVVLKKIYNGEELLIVMNISENANTVDLSTVSINGKEAGKLEVVGTLLDTAEMVTVEGSTLSLPAYAIEFLK